MSYEGFEVVPDLMELIRLGWHHGDLAHDSDEYTYLDNLHWFKFTTWDPDLEHNPQFAHLPVPVYPSAIVVPHFTRDGLPCGGAYHFNVPGINEAFGGHYELWDYTSLDPLSVTQIMVCRIPADDDGRICGDSGYIQNGRWIPA